MENQNIPTELALTDEEFNRKVEALKQVVASAVRKKALEKDAKAQAVKAEALAQKDDGPFMGNSKYCSEMELKLRIDGLKQLIVTCGTAYNQLYFGELKSGHSLLGASIYIGNGSCHRVGTNSFTIDGKYLASRKYDRVKSYLLTAHELGHFYLTDSIIIELLRRLNCHTLIRKNPNTTQQILNVIEDAKINSSIPMLFDLGEDFLTEMKKADYMSQPLVEVKKMVNSLTSKDQIKQLTLNYFLAVTDSIILRNQELHDHIEQMLEIIEEKLKSYGVKSVSFTAVKRTVSNCLQVINRELKDEAKVIDVEVTLTKYLLEFFYKVIDAFKASKPKMPKPQDQQQPEQNSDANDQDNNQMDCDSEEQSSDDTSDDSCQNFDNDDEDEDDTSNDESEDQPSDDSEDTEEDEDKTCPTQVQMFNADNEDEQSELPEQLKKDICTRAGLEKLMNDKLHGVSTARGKDIGEFKCYDTAFRNTNISKAQLSFVANETIARADQTMIDLSGNPSRNFDPARIDKIIEKYQKSGIELSREFEKALRGMDKKKYSEPARVGFKLRKATLGKLAQGRSVSKPFVKKAEDVAMNTHIVFLVDTSGSMEGDRIEAVLGSLAIFNGAFSHIKTDKLKTSVYSFSDSFKELKNASQPFDKKVLERMPFDGSTDGYRATNIGLATLIKDKTCERKILITLTDGNFQDYSGDVPSLEEIDNLGIESVCIHIGTDEYSYQSWASENTAPYHKVIPVVTSQIDKLPQLYVKLISELLNNQNKRTRR